jgi:hypothetical protein
LLRVSNASPLIALIPSRITSALVSRLSALWASYSFPSAIHLSTVSPTALFAVQLMSCFKRLIVVGNQW